MKTGRPLQSKKYKEKEKKGKEIKKKNQNGIWKNTGDEMRIGIKLWRLWGPRTALNVFNKYFVMDIGLLSLAQFSASWIDVENWENCADNWEI